MLVKLGTQRVIANIISINAEFIRMCLYCQHGAIDHVDGISNPASFLTFKCMAGHCEKPACSLTYLVLSIAVTVAILIALTMSAVSGTGSKWAHSDSVSGKTFKKWTFSEDFSYDAY